MASYLLINRGAIVAPLFTLVYKTIGIFAAHAEGPLLQPIRDGFSDGFSNAVTKSPVLGFVENTSSWDRASGQGGKFKDRCAILLPKPITVDYFRAIVEWAAANKDMITTHYLLS